MKFLGWQDPTCVSFGASPCVLAMQDNHNVHARFSDNDRIFGHGFEDEAP